MEKLIKKVVDILNDFSRQEMGNRLSTYAWGTFANALVNAIKNYEPESKPIKEPESKPIKSEVKEDVKK